MRDIKELIDDLSWNKPESTQKKAMSELLKVSDKEAILLAHLTIDLPKDCMENASLVLKEMGYPRNSLAIPYVMEWFKDVNWPGFYNIIGLLKEINKDIVVPHIEDAAQQALNEKDEMWALGLVLLIKNLSISSISLNNCGIYDELLNLVEGEG